MEEKEIRDDTETKTKTIDDPSPIEQVRLAVPITDDPTLPVITFRTWVLGPIACIFIAFNVQYFSYRQNHLDIPIRILNLLMLPVGKFMADKLPTKQMRFPGTNWTFTLNPGPFNMKEHALISILASSGSDYPLGLEAFVLSKLFYKKALNIWLTVLLTLSTQVSGYGLAGIFMHFLVSSPYMWWPNCLVDVALFRAMHEVEVRSKGHLTSIQFFLMVSVSSFAYSIVPGYFFPSISTLSVVCWFWKDSVLAQQIGSGRFGLGIGSIALDWSALGSAFGNPLVAPMFAIVNTMVGFLLFLYIIAPISYWLNMYDAKRFPFSSYDLLDYSGNIYNTTRVLSEDLTLNRKAYQNYSKIYMSTVSIYATGFEFSMYIATITEFLLYHARDALCQFKESFNRKTDNRQFGDVHNRLMKEYKTIPHWWFFSILMPMIGIAIFTCEGFGKQLQVPYWLVLIGYLMVIILILPFGVIEATTGQQSLDLYLISEMVIGYAYPGKPLANLVFKAYGFSTMNHAITFMSDLKLGHYMKIPPKSMFFIQVFGTILSLFVNMVTAWLVVTTVDNVCDVKKLPLGSPWTCPSQRNRLNANLVWGLVGPSDVYAPHGLYSRIYYFFLLGAVVPLLVWVLLRVFPKTKWIKLISVPMILVAPTVMPNVGAVNIWSAFIVAMVFNCIVYRRYKGWWAKYNYLLVCGLEFGIVVMGSLTSFTLQAYGIFGVSWWGLDVNDHCPLAQCPTAPGVRVDGCPLF